MPFAGLRATFNTLRVRLLIWITLAVVLMVVVTMLTVRQVVHRTLLAEFDKVLMDDSKEIALMLRGLPEGQIVEKGFPGPLEKALNRKAMVHAHQGWFVQIYNDIGDHVWSSENTPEDLLSPEFDFDKPRFWEHEPYRMLVSSLPHGQLSLRLGSSKNSLAEDVELLNRIMLLATLLIALVAPLGAYALAGRATRPLAWIIATTARLQPQKLDERLPIRGSDDELDQLSQTINGMLDRIASYIERHRDFIANAAHELRSPLAAIRTSVEVALNRPRSTEDYQNLLTDVVIECSRLGNLVNRLLMLAEGDAGRLAVRAHRVDVDKLVRESVDMFQPVAESQGIDLHIESSEPIQVLGDELHLRQVIRNLIDNAIKFNLPPGEVRINVYGDAERNAKIVVADTGVGISAENLPRIFERFYCVDKARSRETGSGGYGLGLSICQVIVRSMGGDITVKSQPGQGTTFIVTLPLSTEPNLALANS